MSRTDVDEVEAPPVPPQIPRMDAAPRSSPSMPEPAPWPGEREYEMRPGDTGEDRPPQVPRGLQPLSEADLRALAAEEELLLRRELREAEELINSDPSVMGLPGYLSHPLMLSLMIGMGSVLGLFVFNQAAQALALIGTLQGWMLYGGYVALGLLAVAALYAMLRLAYLYLRLRRNRQLRIKGLEELEKRTKLRWLVNAKLKEAKTLLVTYIREYPLAGGREQKRLISLGMDEDTLAHLVAVRERLLDVDRWPSDDAWFAEFRDCFQSKLDEAAKQRIGYWARRTGLGTALSPNALTDTLMTLYMSFTMLADLCQIYNLRAGRLGTAVILTRVFFNSYLAGQMQDMESMTSDQIQNLVAPHFPASELLLAKVVGKVGAKAGTGTFNYFLLSRLGKYSCRMLRPVTQE